jgi:hypothetical protein
VSVATRKDSNRERAEMVCELHAGGAMPARRFSSLMPLMLLAALGGCEGSGAAPRRAADRPGDRPVERGRPAEPRPEPDAIESLNNAARESYASARARAVARQEPVLFVRFDELFLYWNGEHTTGRSGPNKVSPRLHRLKAISHAVSLGAYPALYDCAQALEGGHEGWQKKKAELEGLKQKIAAARGKLDEVMFEAAEKARQERILSTTERYLGEVVASGNCPSQDSLRGFVRGLRSDLAANTTATARLYLDHLHRETQALLALVPERERSKLTVLIAGTQLPRAQNAATQYYARLLGVRGEGPRLIYAEQIFAPDQALKLLGAHRLDREIAIAFFDEEWRMHRDLLADDAAEYVPTLVEPLRARD